MKFNPLKRKRNKSVVKLLKLIFPAISVAVIWKMFNREKRKGGIGFRDSLMHGELFWQSFFTKFQKKSENTNFLEISYKGKFCGVVAYSNVVFFKKTLFLKFFAIKKRFQGKGIGTKVIKDFEKMSKRKGFKYIFLLSSPFKKNQAFYFKRGYSRMFWGLFWKKL